MEYVEQYISGQPDIELTSRFLDEGETGTNYDRKGFQNMMTAVQMGQINCVVVKDLSRIGRNFLETGELMEVTFPILGVRLIAINDLTVIKRMKMPNIYVYVTLHKNHDE